jgi:formylglycine-generating enzyme required for sulfatase activity
VFTHEDLARSLEGLAADQEIEVKILRKEKPLTLQWIPFRQPLSGKQNAIQAGRLISSFEQLGLTFLAYRLSYTKDNLLGITRDDSPLECELEAGSYLFVLRKPGYGEVRVPFSSPGEGAMESVRLVPLAEVPPGFVYIPRGLVQTGGDPKAFQSLPWSTITVNGFFMSKLEVTFGEWLEFLNDPDVLQRTNMAGELIPGTEAARKLLARGKERFPLVPRETKLTRASPSAPWTLQLPMAAHEWAAFGVSHLAAIEYAAWLTKRPGGGKTVWTFRLPTDEEWERAARGVDRRIYPWGNYLVWSFAVSNRGIQPPIVPRPVGSYPFDESVFGIRDLAGSVTEHTTGRPGRGLPFPAYRGGSWEILDEEFFHIASRNSMAPDGIYPKRFGLRLVAELRPQELSASSFDR